MDARRALSVAGLTGSAALLAAAGGATWFYASRVVEPPLRRPIEPIDADRVTIVDRRGDELVLAGPDAHRPGWWGVRWDGGYARVGPPTDPAGPQVPRPISPAGGRPTAHPRAARPVGGPRRRPDGARRRGRGGRGRGPIGPLPAWRFTPGVQAERGGPATWAVLVHGRSGSRAETHRLAGICLDAGLTTLTVSYRNDPDAPASPDGRSHLGATEWMDVEAAVAWALADGADDVVLVGLSMGGACVTELLRRSELADPGPCGGAGGARPRVGAGDPLGRGQRGLPPAVLPLLLPPTLALAGRRTGIDFRSLGSFDGIAPVPVLLVHGDADATVPVELADALADAAPEVVTYLRVAGAGHLRAWNLARDEVEAAVRGFLAERVPAVTAPPTPTGP
jgi:uncharacterized protein